jgi:hypothetical protein
MSSTKRSSRENKVRGAPFSGGTGVFCKCACRFPPKHYGGPTCRAHRRKIWSHTAGHICMAKFSTAHSQKRTRRHLCCNRGHATVAALQSVQTFHGMCVMLFACRLIGGVCGDTSPQSACPYIHGAATPFVSEARTSNMSGASLPHVLHTSAQLFCMRMC